MKQSFALLAVMLLAIAPAQGEEKHDHSAQPEKQQGMHDHMKTMRDQIAQIRGARDPKEKDRLVAEHMTTMEEAMARMQGMGCGKM
jgi:hypothetical protein